MSLARSSVKQDRATISAWIPTAKTDPLQESIYRLEDALDKLVERGMDVWYGGIGKHLEGVTLVKTFQERPLAETAPLIAIATIMGSLYTSFSWAYMPAVGILPTSTSSVVFHSSFVLAALSFERGVTVDPGGIPDDWEKGSDGRPLFEQEGSARRYFLLEKKRSTGELRFCKKELKFKPDRAHFCSAMQRNILRMDHYCPWLANCVGYHNHKFFILFLFYTVVASATLDFSVLQALSAGSFSGGHTFMMTQGALMSSLLTGILGPFCTFHCWLMSHNMTTIEYCEKKRDRQVDGLSPYDLGLYRNVQCVMGDNWVQWLLPMTGPNGDGLQWGIAEEKESVGATSGRAESSDGTSPDQAAGREGDAADRSMACSEWLMAAGNTLSGMMPNLFHDAKDGFDELKNDFNDAVSKYLVLLRGPESPRSRPAPRLHSVVQERRQMEQR
eukprot:TRINITY_DN67319_c0_g1_i1.p1 TRINITY_DN67319_c0_g1~~TRINITY_DN67319_c0_g1_i1.p1  ORF type:complete len:444 (-),score=93.07 TRINITY_DN67319_c0_g1_i1:20-1351(-)